MASTTYFSEWAVEQGFTNGGTVKARLEACEIGLARLEKLQDAALESIEEARASTSGQMFEHDEFKGKLVLSQVAPTMDQVEFCLFKASQPQLDEVAQEPHDNAQTALAALVQKHRNFKKALRELEEKWAGVKKETAAEAAPSGDQARAAPVIYGGRMDSTLPVFDGDKFGYKAW